MVFQSVLASSPTLQRSNGSPTETTSMIGWLDEFNDYFPRASALEFETVCEICSATVEEAFGHLIGFYGADLAHDSKSQLITVYEELKESNLLGPTARGALSHLRGVVEDFTFPGGYDITYSTLYLEDVLRGDQTKKKIRKVFFQSHQAVADFYVISKLNTPALEGSVWEMELKHDDCLSFIDYQKELLKFCVV